MSSQINIEGLNVEAHTFAEMEETHMATMTDLGTWANDFATHPVETEAHIANIREWLRSKISDMQSYLETLSAKDFPRGSLGLHGTVFSFEEGIEAAAS